MPEISCATALVDFRLFLASKMKDKTLTQRALGELVGVGQCAVSHYETGRRRPERDVVRKFVALARRHKYPRTEVLIESLI